MVEVNEGASSHCITENRSLMSQAVFDWLDEVFEEPKPEQRGSE
jgi:hypothetical protein